jgi:hypothetical protein
MVRHPETHVIGASAPVHTPAHGVEVRAGRLGPSRGLVLDANERGASFHPRDVLRWVRLNRTVYKTDKIDFLCEAGPESATQRAAELLAYARPLDLRVSLRSSCAGPPPDLTRLHGLGLLDVFLTPRRVTEPALSAWMSVAAQAGLPIRLQVPFPLHSSLDAEKFAKQFASAGVTVVNLAAHDPFLGANGSHNKTQSMQSLERAGALTHALESLGIECNLLGVPFCLTDRKNWPAIANSRQFFADHQHYRQDSYELALKLRRRPAVIAGKILSIIVGKYTLFDNPIDNKLLPWLLDSPWLRARVVAWHKLTRHLRLARGVPAPTPPETEARAEKALQRRRREAIRRLGPLCGICSLRHICDHESPELKRALPGAEVTPQDGEIVMNPLHFAVQQPKYYDEVDRDRIESAASFADLADRARTLMDARPPDREIDAFEYKTEGQWCHQLPGGVRWFGFTNTEKLSTPLASIDPPFTLSVLFGGGIAEFAGFSLGRECKLVCPMDAYRHQIVLHVEADGRYVLLRDGEAVRPVTFEGHYYVPLRLGDRLEPRISLWNIDNSIVTQNVALWSEHLRRASDRPAPKFSVVTVCVKYARRLQTALQAVAHQQGIPHSDIEIIVAYVPDADPTEDVLEALALAYPGLAIHRSTFNERKARAKGFLINETLRKASGEWVVLLDADTILPPNFFQEVLARGADANFIVPDGRKLLGRETTAHVLLGDIRPWEHWDELLATEGEFRYREMEGVPIGFCQVVRRSCLDTVQYYEADHFEGADWQFSIDMRKHFGQELRLSGVPVLHLDHGGSKWYGTSRHF